MRRTSMQDAEAFKACVTLIHDELVAKGSYDLKNMGLCRAITNAGGSWSCDAYAMMPRLFTELEDQFHIEPRGVWGPHRLGLICLLNSLSVDELYEIANSPIGVSCPQ